MHDDAAAFSTLLREKMAELDADEESALRLLDDPIERLALEAQQAILAADGTSLPRGGHQAYTRLPEPAPEPASAHLNVLY